jgi:hypothetical protein
METVLISKIKEILERTLPAGCYIKIAPVKLLGGTSIKIFFAASDYDINSVSEQKPQAVSLRLDVDSLELKPQTWGGMGGQCIYREPNKDDPKERYLAMKSVKVPFRKPQQNEVAVMAAIERFAKNWIKTIKDNIDTIKYKELVNYNNIN